MGAGENLAHARHSDVEVGRHCAPRIGGCQSLRRPSTGLTAAAPCTIACCHRPTYRQRAATMPESYIRRILEANVYDVAIETPIQPAPLLSRRYRNQILLKREDLQPVHSFKLRGAYNKMVKLTPEARAAGVICASAGNHAQGVALAAQRLKIRATIVMPRTTPAIKVAAVRALGGKVLLQGDSFDEAFIRSQQLMAEQQLTYIHPYDDPDVIAGQGTIGMEILRQHTGALDALFVPVGGGGLMAGIAAYIKYLRPEIRLIAVEAEESACLAAALAKRRRVVLPQVGLFADGVAVAQIGQETFRVLRKSVDEVITVTTDEICAAIKDLFSDIRAIAEPAGALALAGLKQYVERNQVEQQTLMALLSGANVNFDRLRHIAERAELGERREAVLAVTIPERPGSFHAFCTLLGRRNITEFNYRYNDPQQARIFVGVEVNEGAPGEGRAALIEKLHHHGYPVVDMTDNEMAKLHIRHMVGGHATDVADERLYRFEFPERPGALLNFLSRLGERWNITLFHYRNHGAAYGRVLSGIQVPRSERARLNQELAAIGYPWWDESENPAYRLFLR
ncbi:MAG TPA: threonine ammonia-lyase, biosynthetic [Pseudomonadales bacterium]|nr:threonine ammonia-lyase, biosynthetic [Pseudomonadales bacterium]